MKIHPLVECLDHKFQINIDTVEFSASNVELESLGTTKIIVTSSDGEFLKTSANRKAIVGKYPDHALQVRYEERMIHIGKIGVLFVEGSLFGFGFGQNVYTSGKLRSGCISALRNIQRQTGFIASDETWDRWRNGDIALHRIDLAVNFDLGSESAVRALCKRLAHQLVGKNTHCHVHDGYASLAPRRGTQFSVTAYAKGAQLKSKLGDAGLDPNFARLVRESEGLFRVEVRLRRPELVKLNLSFARDWTPEKAREVFREYAAKLPMLDVTSGPVSAKELERIPPKLHDVLYLHKLGVDLTTIYPPRTAARYRAKFRALGIDIACPNLEEAPSNSSLLFRPAKTPKWLIDVGMAPPRKRKTTKTVKAQRQDGTRG